MLPPKEFMTVRQPPRSRLCGACVGAIATGKTLEQVLDEWDWRVLASTTGMNQFLAAHGITMGVALDGGDDRILRREVNVTLDPSKLPALICVKSDSEPDGTHWVFWDGKRILDPLGERDHYEFINTHYLQYYEPRELSVVDEFPKDWRLCLFKEKS